MKIMRTVVIYNKKKKWKIPFERGEYLKEKAKKKKKNEKPFSRPFALYTYIYKEEKGSVVELIFAFNAENVSVKARA